MGVDKKEYIKIKNLLEKSLGELSNSNDQETQEIIAETRFDIKNKASADEILRNIETYWKEDYYKLRKKWSLYIFASLAWTILFQYFLAWFLIYWVTNEVFNFDAVHDLFFLIAGENFAQIIWLSYIIVRYLFSKKEE